MSYSKYSSANSTKYHHSQPSSSSGLSRMKVEAPSRMSEKNLPEEFGRLKQEKRDEDDLNILQRMKTAFINSPLATLYMYIEDKKKIKIWTRNFKEIRGMLTGYLAAFDKHWNLILRDVDEVYLRRKKSKTPFLRDLNPNEKLPDMPPKVPRKKRSQTEEQPPPAPPKNPSPKSATGEKREKKKRKKKKNISGKRHVDQIFIRGDTIVMICPVEEVYDYDDDDLCSLEEEVIEGDDDVVVITLN